MDSSRLNIEPVRKSEYAGSFYPSTEKLLTRELEKLFAHATNPSSDEFPQALIAPHAGYVFSGKVAASAYNRLPPKAEYRRVFILAPSHHFSFKGASVSNAGSFETPLGKVKIDVQVVKKLTDQSNLFHFHPKAQNHEHSLEVQLPFLQYKLGKNFLLVPLVLGSSEMTECEKIARMLKPWFNQENLFVASTDFSHYPAYDDAVENDFNTAQAICSNNPEILMKTLSRSKNIRNLATSLCGSAPVITLLHLTRHQDMEFQQVHYQNSGDVPGYGDKERVVGYWAIAVYNKVIDLYVPPRLQARMLKNARSAISRFMETGNLVHPRYAKKSSIKTAGMFVSIYIKGQLHGCMGSFGEESSWKEIMEQLAVSACCDTRFEKLRKEELEDMELEISVLSPLKQVHSISEIEPGKHGVYIKKGFQTGTLLPQVALRNGWTAEELLGFCARDKAGLGWDDWKDAEIYTYEAFVFRG